MSSASAVFELYAVGLVFPGACENNKMQGRNRAIATLERSSVHVSFDSNSEWSPRSPTKTLRVFRGFGVLFRGGYGVLLQL